MMERNINKKYLEIHKKKDLPGKKMSIRNRFTYYPLYDVDKNSYIRRYRLWLKYKEYNSIKEAGENVNGNPIFISNITDHPYKTAYGFRWKYKI